jgi:hypothetical protein
MIQTRVNLEILCDNEFEVRYEAEPASKRDHARYGYARWSKMRRNLTSLLKKEWRLDTYGGLGEGDFFIGSDWFETGILSLVVKHWELVNARILRVCHAFLKQPGNSDFLVSLGVAGEAAFQIILTSSRVYGTVGACNKPEVPKAVEEDSRLKGIRELICVSGGDVAPKPKTKAIRREPSPPEVEGRVSARTSLSQLPLRYAKYQGKIAKVIVNEGTVYLEIEGRITILPREELKKLSFGPGLRGGPWLFSG